MGLEPITILMVWEDVVGNMTPTKEEGIAEEMLAMMVEGTTLNRVRDELVLTLNKHEEGLDDKGPTEEEM